MTDHLLVPKPENRPGLSQLTYRIGEYSTVRQRLLSQLSGLTLVGNRPLERLTTRSPDDPAIALLDAWAIVMDILSFYQERIINEGYLLTATERRSVLELARAIGYELSPGVAAGTFLAFMVEDSAGSAGVATVAKGTQVLSLPMRQDELPQTFETSADLLARADWNALLPRPTRAQRVIPTTQQLYLSGTSTQLQPGDAVLLTNAADADRSTYLLRLSVVKPLPDRNSTLVQWTSWLPAPPPKLLRDPQLFAFRQKAQLFDQSIRGGVFRLGDDREPWTAQNAGLPNAEIVCLATTNSAVFVGTSSGVFRSMDDGSTWEAVNNGLTLLSVQMLYLGEEQTLFAGTLNGGLFRSSDLGETWVQLNLGGVKLVEKPTGSGKFQSVTTGLPNSVVRSALTYTSGTPAIQNYLVGTDDGIYRSTDRGKKWESVIPDDRAVYALIKNGSRLLAGTNVGVYEVNDATVLDLDSRVVRALEIHGVLTLAGTDVGIYYSESLENSWMLSDRTVGIIYALKSNGAIAYAATDKGVYQSTDGKIWTPINAGLTTPRIVALGSRMGKVFAGGRSTNVSDLEWANFPLSAQEIDLDAQYPRILSGSWAVLQTGDRFAAIQVETATTVARAQATQETKVTRIVPQQPIATPNNFNRRQTIVLAQSEPLALAEEALTVTAQQTQIFSDPLQAETIFLKQFVQGLQPNQLMIVSGRRIQVQMQQAGGIFSADRQSDLIWLRLNQGLENLQVQALAQHRGDRFAGTRQGIFQFISERRAWEPFNAGLSNLLVQSLGSLDADGLLAGTAAGLFKLVDDRWHRVGAELVYQNIQAIAVLPSIVFIGTLNGGVFRSTDGGIHWTATALANVDVMALAARSQTVLAGTRSDGIFYSEDDGISWRQITDNRSGQGSLSSTGVQVTRSGVSNRQASDLQVGDRISVADQTRTILSLSLDQLTLMLDAPFRPDLLPGTPFTIATGLTNTTITALAIASDGTFFAGTGGSGVFRSMDKGDRWTAISANLTDLEIRCLAIETDRSSDPILFAGTASGGVFRSTNAGNRDPLVPVLWASVNLGLTNTDVRAIAIEAKTLLVGGIGILISEASSTTVELQRGDVLQVLVPPVEVKPTDSLTDPIAYQRWLLKNRDGFVGTLDTLSSDVIATADLILLPAAKNSALVSELVEVDVPPDDQQHPVLRLKAPLKYSYDPATVAIAANVVRATHGETVQEVLGSGDGRATNQRFVLKKPPLTYVSVATAAGAASSLELRVNGILWQEAASLFSLGEQAENYAIRLEDDGTIAAIFGDGINGARLPSGVENVTATYRSGIGLAGNMGANRLSLLKTQPLGIREVNNPLSASGAADREPLAEAKVKAPRTVRTLDRIVSLRDFEDFTRTFAGIGKAQAIALWTGNAQIVHLTIAGAAGDAVLPESALYQNLLAAIDAARDPVQRVQVDSYQPLRFNLEAKLLIDPRYEVKTVIAKVRSALLQTFSFDPRAFGQTVTAAEAIATLQPIEGMIAVDLDALYRLSSSKTLEQILPADRARWNEAIAQIDPAQLLLINPDGIRLTPVLTL